MNATITQHSELITTVVTLLIGAILRAIEKKRLRKKGLLIDEVPKNY